MWSLFTLAWTHQGRSKSVLLAFIGDDAA